MLPAALLVVSLALSAAAPAPRLQVPDGDVVHGELGQELDQFLTRLSQDGFAGSVLVAEGETLYLKRGYGMADREQGIANDSTTLFDVGTLAQIWTSAAILHLAEAGRLDVEAPVSRYLGAFPDQRNQATIHQLMIHTSGMVPPGTRLSHDSREAFVASIREEAARSVPGAEFSKSAEGYVLLAAVVEEVSGVSFERYLRKFLLGPAGMSSTGFAWEKRWRRRQAAVGYEGVTADDLEVMTPSADLWSRRGPGNVVTTVGDIYRWILALRQGRILSRATVAEMFQAYVGSEGYSWHVIENSTRGRLVRRGSATPGFESSVRWYLDTDLVIIFAINSNIGFRIQVARGIADILEGHIPAPGRMSTP